MEGGRGQASKPAYDDVLDTKSVCTATMMVDLHNPFFVLTFQHALAFFTKRDAGFPYQTLHASHM